VDGTLVLLGGTSVRHPKVVTTMYGMAECAAMAAKRRCHREGCWAKTDGVTVVLVGFFRFNMVMVLIFFT
jgi:hypothetical protein